MLRFRLFPISRLVIACREMGESYPHVEESESLGFGTEKVYRVPLGDCPPRLSVERRWREAHEFQSG